MHEYRNCLSSWCFSATECSRVNMRKHDQEVVCTGGTDNPLTLHSLRTGDGQVPSGSKHGQTPLLMLSVAFS